MWNTVSTYSAGYGKFRAVINLLCIILIAALCIFGAEFIRRKVKASDTEAESKVKRSSCSTSTDKKGKTSTSCNSYVVFTDKARNKDYEVNLSTSGKYAEGDKIMVVYPKDDPTSAMQKNNVYWMSWTWPILYSIAICMVLINLSTVIAVFSSDTVASGFGIFTGISNLASIIKRD